MDLRSIGYDIKHSYRALIRRPMFTGAAILCVMLGVSSSVAVFTLVRSELLRPLPFRDPGQLVRVTMISARQPAGAVLTPEFAAWRSESRTLASLGAWNDARVTITGGGVEPAEVRAALVNGQFLDVLGVQPVLGHPFTLVDDQNRRQVVILSHAMWRRDFKSDAQVVGKSVLLNDKPYEIRGVLPQTFQFPGGFQPELLMLGGYSSPSDWSAKVFGQLNVIGRLAPGVSRQQVVAEIDSIQARHAADVPATFGGSLAGRTPQVIGLADHLRGDSIRMPLLFLMAAVALVALIAAIDVTGLLLARMLTRGGELSVRTALGANPSNISTLVLGECVLVVLAGTGLGVLGARFLIEVLPRIGGRQLVAPRTDVYMDMSVLAFALGLGLCITCMCGVTNVLVARKFSRKQLATAAGRPIATGWTGVVRYGLVVAQVAISFVLLTGAALLLRSFENVLNVDVGIRTENVLTVELRLPSSRYNEERLRQFASALVERVRGLPGVEGAAVTNSLPFTPYSMGAFLLTDMSVPGDLPKGAAFVSMSSEYLRIFGMPIIAGQPLPEGREGPESVLVNQTFARTFFPGVDPVGRRIKRGDETLTVAGIVPDVRHAGPEQPAAAEVFFSYDRDPGARLGLAVLAAPSQESERLAGVVRNEIRTLDPALPIGEMRTLDQRRATATGSRRFQLWLVTGFAAFAFVLAALGLYASIAYSVNASRREIAVRMALGANGSLIRYQYVRKGLVVCAIGLAVGAVASLWVGQHIEGLLFGIHTFDPVSGAAAAGVILASGLIASFVPALSASKTDANRMLRFE